MNNWQLIPKSGISLGEINITFSDSWLDISKKLNLEQRNFNGKILKNILNTKASIKFSFTESLSEMMFFNASIYYEDIQFIGSDGDIVIQQLINKNMRIFYDSTRAYICTELGIYFSIQEDVGGEGVEIDHIGICPSLDDWALLPNIYEVTGLEME